MSAAETSAALGERVAAAGTEVARAAERVGGLTERRRAALLDGDARAFSRIEAELAKAEVDHERSALVLDDLRQRLAAAEQAEREAAQERERKALAALCRARLEAAARVDAAIAALVAAVDDWQRQGDELGRRWVVHGHADRLGPLRPEFVDPAAPLRGAIPAALALMLRMPPSTGLHGARLLAETDPAGAALAKLEAGPPPTAARPAEDAGPRVIHATPGHVARLPAGA